jgi:glucan biosynthesis protein C
LLAFSLVAAVLFRFVPSLSVSGPALLLLPLVSFCFHATASLLLGKHMLVAGIDLNAILTYAPFFLFGLALFPNSIGHRSLPWIGFLFVIAAGLHFVEHRAAELIGHSALVWAATLLCLFACKRALDRDPMAARYFAEASYTIYLFHHILVVAFALALRYVPLSAYAKFGLIVVAVSFSTVGIHHVLIRPYRLTSLLFNGRKQTT